MRCLWQVDGRELGDDCLYRLRAEEKAVNVVVAALYWEVQQKISECYVLWVNCGDSRFCQKVEHVVGDGLDLEVRTAPKSWQS
jgi:hypothetical protein